MSIKLCLIINDYISLSFLLKVSMCIIIEFDIHQSLDINVD